MPGNFLQVQDAAQQVLAKLNAVDIAKLANQLSTLLTDAQADLASGDVHTMLANAATMLRTIDEAVRAADLPALTADIRHTSSALHDTLQGEQLQNLLTNAGLAADRFATAARRGGEPVGRQPALVSRFCSCSPAACHAAPKTCA